MLLSSTLTNEKKKKGLINNYWFCRWKFIFLALTLSQKLEVLHMTGRRRRETVDLKDFWLVQRKNKKGVELGKKLLIIFKSKKYLALCFGFQLEIPFIEQFSFKM